MNDTRTSTFEMTAERAAGLLGQTRGAIVLVGAGLGWMISGLSALGDVPLGLFLVVLAVAALLLLSAAAVRRSASGIAEMPWSPQMRRGFMLAFGAETVAIAAIFAVASLLHRPIWIPPLVALAVGLHFLPLAWLFRRPLYYVTGAALCAVCVATIAFMPPQWGGASRARLAAECRLRLRHGIVGIRFVDADPKRKKAARILASAAVIRL